MLAGVPVVHLAITPSNLPPALPDDRIVGVLLETGIIPTLELALHLQPQTREVVFVNDGSEMNRISVEALDAFTNSVSFLWLTNRSLPELRQELSQLSGQTLVVYGTIFRDSAGNTFTPQAALPRKW